MHRHRPPARGGRGASSAASDARRAAHARSACGRERRTGVRAALSARDGAAMRLDEVADDGEAEAEAAVTARGRRVAPGGTVEDVRQEVRRRCPGPVSLTRDLDVAAPSLDARRRCGRRAGVNFTALASRFQSTCCSRPASPASAPTRVDRARERDRLARRPRGGRFRPRRRSDRGRSTRLRCSRRRLPGDDRATGRAGPR